MEKARASDSRPPAGHEGERNSGDGDGDGRDGAVEETPLAGQGLGEARASKDRASEPVCVEGACLGARAVFCS
ncbi:hypothetical protein GTR04_4073 [Trichophyton interdigitale]|uniref:Uncharacterized protein n=1 Tax=Trichophyton interdigitale TaxID=101480 RepID=A0A9P5CUZ3_9EURO|nr:hypothetical protein GY631_3817 [Trichophyton interdigitale]KAF3894888.1 hypothetical protein GY632_3526 [Trichophyton interdigitale]KAG8208562.1 hypothetical protein GTR04_4073 [Trichophyton interdigitale]